MSPDLVYRSLVRLSCGGAHDLPGRADGDIGVGGEGERLHPVAGLGGREERGGEDRAADGAEVVDARVVVAAGGRFVQEVRVVPRGGGVDGDDG
jgi:hypothetical protein